MFDSSAYILHDSRDCDSREGSQGYGLRECGSRNYGSQDSNSQNFDSHSSQNHGLQEGGSRSDSRSRSALRGVVGAALQEMQRQCGERVRELCADSRRVSGGDVFVAYRGLRVDGRDYIHAALQAGASGVFWDPDGFCWPEDLQVPNVAVENLHDCVGWLADAVYDSPSAKLPVLAITATNGKSTAAHFVAQILSAQNINCGILGTLGAGVAFWRDDSPCLELDDSASQHTTPDAIGVHRHLRDCIKRGARAAVLEASSHGIAQQRLGGVRLQAAALINIGRDHLDYHKTMAEYRKIKMQLLQTDELQTAVLHAQLLAEFSDVVGYAESSAGESAESAEGVDGFDVLANGAQLQTFGAEGKAMRLLEVVPCRQHGKLGQQIVVEGLCGRREFFLPFVGRHNVDNFMAAALLAHAAGADWQTMDSEILTLPQGRLQRVHGGHASFALDDGQRAGVASACKRAGVASERAGVASKRAGVASACKRVGIDSNNDSKRAGSHSQNEVDSHSKQTSDSKQTKNDSKRAGSHSQNEVDSHSQGGGLLAVPAVFVDYAHTPDALRAVLSALRDSQTSQISQTSQTRGGRLWLVFGCGGERDEGKRGEMGAVAAEFCDVIIVTDDNPRGESAAAIRAEIICGIRGICGTSAGEGMVREVGERAAAIRAAIGEAAAEDVVLIAGKGHEKYQEIDGKRLPFSDVQVAADCINQLHEQNGGRG